MLAEIGDQIDAVSVCTPNGVHMPAAVAALNAGKPVLGEKPMAMNAKEAQAIADAAKANGVRVCHRVPASLRAAFQSLA